MTNNPCFAATLGVPLAFIDAVPAIDSFYAIQPQLRKLTDEPINLLVRRKLQLIRMRKNRNSTGVVDQLNRVTG